MATGDGWVVVGLDNGGNKNNATVLDAPGRFLGPSLPESPSRGPQGPGIALPPRAQSVDAGPALPSRSR